MGDAALTIAMATDADLAVLEAYLAAHSDTCMLLRSNLRAVGLAWTAPAGAHLQGQYAIARRGGAVVGVAAHCWNGNVLFESEAHAGELAVDVVRHSGRRIEGLIGARDAVATARTALGLDAVPANAESDETLMALTLDQLVIPPVLRDGAVTARRGAPRDRELLIAWRIAYGAETGLETGPGAPARAADSIDRYLAARAPALWIVERDGVPVATCTQPAVLPDSVQIGGVYTPPALRGRGHARAVVAASLLDARAAGATRAILFTPRADAIAAYRAVGFAPIGHYALVVFAA